MLPNSPDVRAVCLGENGIIEGSKPGLMLIDMSSIDPVETKAIGAKLANQVIVATNIAAVAEALSLAKKNGADPELVYQAIRGGLAGSTVLDAKAPMMLEHSFKPGFRIELHMS